MLQILQLLLRSVYRTTRKQALASLIYKFLKAKQTQLLKFANIIRPSSACTATEMNIFFWEHSEHVSVRDTALTDQKPNLYKQKTERQNKHLSR